MPESGLSEEASRGENSCRKALDGDEDNEVKSRRGGAQFHGHLPPRSPLLSIPESRRG